MSHLINFRSIGRLGNQMFQAAACIGYAKKYGATWGCQGDTREVPRLREFFPAIPVVDGMFKTYNNADPLQFDYIPLSNFQRDTTLVGFFQSEKYFEGSEDEIRRVFKLDIKPVDAVSIHVRRGDYVQHSNSFPPVTIDYIHRSINKIWNLGFEQKLTKFIIFSDDIKWCKDNIKDANGFAFEYSESENEFEDLSFMASCKHHIIANSTFSWWGAWLGHNPDKIVVSPSADNWFGPGFTGGVPKDLIPDSWHQIKFR